MSPLRQEALQILEATPEEGLTALLRFMRMAKSQPAETNSVEQKRRAFEELGRIIRSKKINLPADFDEKEELAKYREERYGNANFG